jgi:hypothetical protein
MDTGGDMGAMGTGALTAMAIGGVVTIIIMDIMTGMETAMVVMGMVVMGMVVMGMVVMGMVVMGMVETGMVETGMVVMVVMVETGMW